MPHDVRYTTIQHEARLKLGLSNNNYCIADSIYHLANQPDHRICEKSNSELAEFIGIDRRSVVNILEKLVKNGLVERVKHGSTRLGLQPTTGWYEHVEQHKINLDQQGHGFRYTTVLHEPRVKLGISINAYCIADSIYRLSNRPGHPNCTAKLEDLGAFIGISEKSARNLKNKLISLGLVEKVTKGYRHLGFRTTTRWYEEVVIFTREKDREKSSATALNPLLEGDDELREKSSVAGKKVPPSREISSAKRGKEVPPDEEKSSAYTNNTDTNTDKQQQLLSSMFEELKISIKAREGIESEYSAELIRKVLEALREKGNSSANPIENPTGWVIAALKKAAKGEFDFQETAAEQTNRIRQRQNEADAAKQEEEKQTAQRDAEVDTWIDGHESEYQALLQQSRSELPESFQMTGQSKEIWVKANARVLVRKILEGEVEAPASTQESVEPKILTNFRRRPVRKKKQAENQQMLFLAA